MNRKYIICLGTWWRCLDGLAMSVIGPGDGRGLFLFVYLRLGVTNIVSQHFPQLNNNILTNYKTEEISA